MPVRRDHHAVPTLAEIAEALGELGGVALGRAPGAQAQVETFGELREPQLHPAFERIVERAQRTCAGPLDRLSERLGFLVCLTRAVERPMGIGHHHPGAFGQQLSGRGHLVEQQRRQRFRTFHEQSVRQSLEPVGEPVRVLLCALERPGAQGVVGDQLSDGRHVDRGDLLGGQLRGRDEFAERLDLIAPELQARGTPGGTGEDVDDAAPHRELAAVLHHVGPRVAEVDEPLGQVVGRELPAGHQLQRRYRAQRGDDALHRGERGRDQHERSPRFAEPVEGVGPASRDLGRGRDLLVRQGFPRRQHGDAVVPQERGDVVLERFGFPRTGRHGEHRGLERRGDAGDHEVLTGLGPRQDRPGALEQHPLERFGGDQVSEDLLQAHPTLPATPRTGLVAARQAWCSEGTV